MIQVYTLPFCPSCLAAKQFLNSKKQTFKEININDTNISRDELYNLTGGRTVPQILIDNKTIGGFDSLLALDQSGKLPF